MQRIKNIVYIIEYYMILSSMVLKKAIKIVYGRTAAEFKSTIGAVPVKSKSAIYISNKILRLLLYPIAKNLTPKSWIQRNPFKAKSNE